MKKAMFIALAASFAAAGSGTALADRGTSGEANQAQPYGTQSGQQIGEGAGSAQQGAQQGVQQGVQQGAQQGVQQDMERGTTGRAPSGPRVGGGPPTAAQQPPMMTHAAPHIVMVQTELRTANESLQGLSRLAGLAGAQITPDYRTHLNMFVRSIQSDLNTARTHARELRGLFEERGMMAQAATQFQQLDQAIMQAQQGAQTLHNQIRQASIDPTVLQNTVNTTSQSLQRAQTLFGQIEQMVR